MGGLAGNRCIVYAVSIHDASRYWQVLVVLASFVNSCNYCMTGMQSVAL